MISRYLRRVFGNRIRTLLIIGFALLQPAQAIGQNVSTQISSAPSFATMQQAAQAHRTAYQRIGNVFAEAQGRALLDSDLDSYIDPSVAVGDRKVAHNLMMMMPANRRGDFVLFDRNQRRLISNNPAMLRYVYVSINNVALASSKRVALAQIKFHVRSAQSYPIRPLDYSSPCSPPNPNNMQQVGGPFARNVSACGFTTGWGFVNVPCGGSQFASGDAGHLYLEFQGSGIGIGSKSLVEGGLEYYSDSSVAPYLRSAGGYPSGYINMNNNSVRYGCGQNLAIMHGATESGNYTYTNVGQLPAQYNPQVNWVSYGIFTLNNSSWLFETSPGDIVGAGTDPAGIQTPCVTCSISQVTSIAQNNLPQGQNYSYDGSYFGIGSIGAAINWMQVAFGEWESNCVPGTTLCTFDFPSSPAIYSDPGGPQIYPDTTVANTYPIGLGWGPYETFDSVDLSVGGIPAAKRRAQGALTEPPPPLPCTADSQGNCSLEQSHTATSSCQTAYKNIHGVPIYVYSYKSVFSIYSTGRPPIYRETATSNQTLGASPGCALTTRWGPGEPRVQYNDVNLP